MNIRVTVWNEGRQERVDAKVREVHPDGIHGSVKKLLEADEKLIVRTALLDEPDYGLPDALLDQTDVLVWWGHMAHSDLPDAVAEKVQAHVLRGMGAIFLHSAHQSKPFVKLMGTSCILKCRDNARERIWCVNPSHPIAAGIPEQFLLESEEMYGEFFDIPQPDELVFLGWFNGGEVFRSGCTFSRGYGKVFYFQPGHETDRSLFNGNVGRVLRNAVRWAAPVTKTETLRCLYAEPLE